VSSALFAGLALLLVRPPYFLSHSFARLAPPSLQQVYARYGLPQKPGYRVEACMNGKNCATMYRVQELKPCDGNGDYYYGGDGDLDYYFDDYYDRPITFQPIDWQSCGEAGHYEVETSFAFPSGYDLRDRSFSWLSWFESYAYYVDVNAYFTDESEDQDQSEASGDNNYGGNISHNSGGNSNHNSIYTKCSISFKAVNSSTSSSSSRWEKSEMYCMSILGFAALVGGAIACVHHCKEKEKDSQLEGVGDFIVWEVMKNQSGTMT